MGGEGDNSGEKSYEEQLESLRDEIAGIQDDLNDGFFAREKQCVFMTKEKARSTLKGHFGKIYALHWSGPCTPAKVGRLATVSQDGKLIIWDAHTNNKMEGNKS